MYNSLEGICSVKLEERTNPIFRNTIPNSTGTVLGIARTYIERTNGYRSLRIENLIGEDGKTMISQSNTIIKDADLVRGFDQTEINIIIKMMKEEKMPERLAMWIDRIRKSNVNMANKLQNLFNNKTAEVNSSFMDSLYYKIEVNEIGEYAYFKDRANIFLNYQMIGSDLDFLKKLAHELAHVNFRYNNTYEYIKWTVIREQQNNHRYDLADKSGQNGHCSEGAGHEKYNPENKVVCEEEDKYKKIK